jgi:hypothetical protein
LQDAGANLSEPERDSRLRVIDEKTKSLQRSAEDAQNEASGAMNDMYQQLAQKVYAVLDAYSNQKQIHPGARYQRPADAGVVGQPSTDITKAIVDAYNAKSGVPPQPAAGAGTRRLAPSSTTPQPAGTTTHPAPPSRRSRRSSCFLEPPGQDSLTGREIILSKPLGESKNVPATAFPVGCGKNCGKLGSALFRRLQIAAFAKALAKGLAC